MSADKNHSDLQPAAKEAANKRIKLLTLAFLFSEKRDQILLGMKKRGFGKGWWNGFGGKVAEGETIMDGAKREMLEESSINAISLTKRGMIDFEFVDDPVILQVHIYEIDEHSGQPHESEEMLPKWFNVNEIPFENMWPDDKMWFPYLIDKKYFEGYMLFEGHTKILDYKLELKDNALDDSNPN